MAQLFEPLMMGLDQEDLTRITGADQVTVLRLRQRPERLVYHVSLRGAGGQETGQGAIWCFAGDKARRVLGRHPASVLDPRTDALFDRFPADHRLPEIARFLHWITRDAPAEQRAVTAPEVLRYRPGLSCTLRVVQQDGRQVFSKIIAKEDVTRLAACNIRLAAALVGKGVHLVSPLRVQPGLRAITYEAAMGVPFHELLGGPNPAEAIAACQRVVQALHALPSPRDVAAKSLSAADLRARAEESHSLLSERHGPSAASSYRLLDRIRAAPPDFQHHLIHGDMKSDHVFLNAASVTLIDTESMAIGDPRYDLACLEASLIVGTIRNEITPRVLAACRDLVRRSAGTGYDWFLAVARLKAARHFAQRPGNLAGISQALEL